MSAVYEPPDVGTRGELDHGLDQATAGRIDRVHRGLPVAAQIERKRHQASVSKGERKCLRLISTLVHLPLVLGAAEANPGELVEVDAQHA
jgi:hypothetical protein